MKRNSKNIIKCPHCGAEYLPSEIYIPNSLLGKQFDIYKDAEGHIETFFGDDMDLVESYRCDFCNKKFIVNAIIKFNTSSAAKYSTDEYKTKLTKPSLFLDEN